MYSSCPKTKDDKDMKTNILENIYISLRIETIAYDKQRHIMLIKNK